MTKVIIRDPRQCGDVFPARQSVGSGIVIEFVCVLDKHHDGFHKSSNGTVWVNQEWIYRQRGLQDFL